MTSERADIDRDSISITQEAVTVGATPPPSPPGRGERPTVSVVSGPLERPSLTLSEAAEACGVSRSTVRRKHEAGEFPNAFKAGPDNAWRIPVTDLLGAGLRPGRPSPPDAVSEPDERVRAATVTLPKAELDALREQLQNERTRALVAEARLSERAETVDALKEALSEARQRAIEAAPARMPGPVVDVTTPATPAAPAIDVRDLNWRAKRRLRKQGQLPAGPVQV